jgi:hypothetical protein
LQKFRLDADFEILSFLNFEGFERIFLIEMKSVVARAEFLDEKVNGERLRAL